MYTSITGRSYNYTTPSFEALTRYQRVVRKGTIRKIDLRLEISQVFFWTFALNPIKMGDVRETKILGSIAWGSLVKNAKMPENKG